jgi:hypothetical protein
MVALGTALVLWLCDLNALDLACLGAHRWSLERPWRGSATLLVLGKERTRDAIGRACV